MNTTPFPKLVVAKFHYVLAFDHSNTTLIMTGCPMLFANAVASSKFASSGLDGATGSPTGLANLLPCASWQNGTYFPQFVPQHTFPLAFKAETEA